jgi:hypothetical protein
MFSSERKGSVCRSCRNKQRKYPTGEEHAGWGKEMSLETRRKMSISKVEMENWQSLIEVK